MTKDSQAPETARFTIATDDNAPRFCAGDVVHCRMNAHERIKPGDCVYDKGRIVEITEKMFRDKPAYKVFQTVTNEESPARARMFQNYAKNALTGSRQE
ncbi:MAG TPA: hypothetical protein P5175_11070 [Anaerohalosphaeraceae bacterium]|nr:hypothetical protein [Anaerohalosphaeraceae bacterium]